MEKPARTGRSIDAVYRYHAHFRLRRARCRHMRRLHIINGAHDAISRIGMGRTQYRLNADSIPIIVNASTMAA